MTISDLFLDYPVALWAVHRLGGIIRQSFRRHLSRHLTSFHPTSFHSPANPAYSADELVHQLTTSNARLLVVHPDFLSTALTAAKIVGIPFENVVLFNLADKSTFAPSPHVSVEELVADGLSQSPSFTERRLSPGEAKKKVALLSFSSGTTGKPKVIILRALT